MKQKISDIFYKSIETPSLLDIILYKLSKYDNYICNIINGCIDELRYGNKKDKLVHSSNIDIKVKSTETNHAILVHKTKKFQVYSIETCSGLTLDAADNHLIWVKSQITGKEEWKYVKDLTVFDFVYTENEWDHIFKINKSENYEYMYDLTIEEDSHSYFTNGILSHNTTTTGAFLAHHLIFHNDINALVVANKKNTALEIILKIKEFLEGLPFFLKPGIVSMRSDKIKFENGCALKCAATSKTAATGDSILLLYVDEAAVIAPNIIDEFWGSIQPTMSSFAGSQIIMSSTPRGKGNLFHKIYEGAMNGTNGFISTRVDWWEVPGRGEEWEKLQRLELGDEMFDREFGLSFESAGTRLLSANYLKFIDRIKKKYISHEIFNVPKSISEKIIWHPNFDPTSLTYQQLKNRRFLFVIDTALGIEKGAAGKKDADYNIINIFEIKLLSPNRINKNRNFTQSINITDVLSFRLVGIYMDNFKDEEECCAAAKHLTFDVFKSGIKDIDSVRILIEMNFNGNNWVNLFKQHPGYYDLIILKCARGVEADNGTLRYGFKTTGGSHGKNYYCEMGSKLMDRRLIIVQQNDDGFPAKSTIHQLNLFGKSMKGNYEGSCIHDDISITSLFVSIALELKYFKLWIEEWLEELPTYIPFADEVRQMLEIYAEIEPTISDDQFSSFFDMATSHMGQPAGMSSNTYSAILRNALQQLLNPYGMNRLNSPYKPNFF